MIKMVKHGFYGTRQYKIWCGIKRRCFNKNDISYKKYGGKGIVMCDEWANSFLSFWNDIGDGYDDKKQIDRIDNSKGYSKENCRWATLKEQANNKKNIHPIEFNGLKMNMSDWDNYLGLQTSSVRNRIKVLKWPIERALTEKKKKPKHMFLDDRGFYRVEKKVKGKNVFIGRFKTKKEATEALNEFLGLAPQHSLTSSV